MARPVDNVLGEIGSIVDNLRAENDRLREANAKMQKDIAAERESRRSQDARRIALEMGVALISRLLNVPNDEEEPLAFIEKKIKALVVETNRVDLRSDAEGGWFRGRVCAAMRTSGAKSDDVIIDELVGSLNLARGLVQDVSCLRADLASARNSIADVVERSVAFKCKLWEALQLTVPADEEDALNTAKAVVESNRLLREKNADLEARLGPGSLHEAWDKLDTKLREILDIPEETKAPLTEIETRVRNLMSLAEAVARNNEQEKAEASGHAVYVNGRFRGVQKQSWAGVGATKPPKDSTPKLPGERNAFRRKIYKLLAIAPQESEERVYGYIVAKNNVARDMANTIKDLRHQVGELEKRVVAVPNLDQTTLLMVEQAREQDLKLLRRNLADADKTIRRISDAIGKFVSEKDKSPLYDIVEQIEKLGAQSMKLVECEREKEASAATAESALRSLARIGQMTGAIVGPVLDLPRIEEGVKALAEMKRLATSSTYGKAAAESYWALETFKGRLLGALRMDKGSEDDIINVAEALYAKEDDRFHENQALLAKCSRYEECLKELNQKDHDLTEKVMRLKTALNVAYGKFGTKAEGELPTLQAVEIRTILDHAGFKGTSLVNGVRSLAASRDDRLAKLETALDEAKRTVSSLNARVLQMKTTMNSLYGKIGAKAAPTQTNGGVVCDAPGGEAPCACGAWHAKEKDAKVSTSASRVEVLPGDKTNFKKKLWKLLDLDASEGTSAVLKAAKDLKDRAFSAEREANGLRASNATMREQLKSHHSDISFLAAEQEWRRKERDLLKEIAGLKERCDVRAAELEASYEACACSAETKDIVEDWEASRALLTEKDEPVFKLQGRVEVLLLAKKEAADTSRTFRARVCNELGIVDAGDEAIWNAFRLANAYAERRNKEIMDLGEELAHLRASSKVFKERVCKEMGVDASATEQVIWDLFAIGAKNAERVDGLKAFKERVRNELQLDMAAPDEAYWMTFDMMRTFAKEKNVEIVELRKALAAAKIASEGMAPLDTAFWKPTAGYESSDMHMSNQGVCHSMLDKAGLDRGGLTERVRDLIKQLMVANRGCASLSKEIEGLKAHNLKTFDECSAMERILDAIIESLDKACGASKQSVEHRVRGLIADHRAGADLIRSLRTENESYRKEVAALKGSVGLCELREEVAAQHAEIQKCYAKIDERDGEIETLNKQAAKMTKDLAEQGVELQRGHEKIAALHDGAARRIADLKEGPDGVVFLREHLDRASARIEELVLQRRKMLEDEQSAIHMVDGAHNVLDQLDVEKGHVLPQRVAIFATEFEKLKKAIAESNALPGTPPLNPIAHDWSAVHALLTRRGRPNETLPRRVEELLAEFDKLKFANEEFKKAIASKDNDLVRYDDLGTKLCDLSGESNFEAAVAKFERLDGEMKKVIEATNIAMHVDGPRNDIESVASRIRDQGRLLRRMQDVLVRTMPNVALKDMKLSEAVDAIEKKMKAGEEDVFRLAGVLMNLNKMLGREALEGTSVEERTASLIDVKNKLKGDLVSLTAQNQKMKAGLNVAYGKFGSEETLSELTELRLFKKNVLYELQTFAPKDVEEPCDKIRKLVTEHFLPKDHEKLHAILQAAQAPTGPLDYRISTVITRAKTAESALKVLDAEVIELRAFKKGIGAALAVATDNNEVASVRELALTFDEIEDLLLSKNVGGKKKIGEQVRGLVEANEALAKSSNGYVETLLKVDKLLNGVAYPVNSDSDIVGKLKCVLGDLREKSRMNVFYGQKLEEILTKLDRLMPRGYDTATEVGKIVDRLLKFESTLKEAGFSDSHGNLESKLGALIKAWKLEVEGGKTLGRIGKALDKYVPEAKKSPLYDIVEQIEKLGDFKLKMDGASNVLQNLEALFERWEIAPATSIENRLENALTERRNARDMVDNFRTTFERLGAHMDKILPRTGYDLVEEVGKLVDHKLSDPEEFDSKYDLHKILDGAYVLKGNGSVAERVRAVCDFRKAVTKAVSGGPSADLDGVLENVVYHVKQSAASEGSAEKIRELTDQNLSHRNENRNLTNLSIGLKEKVVDLGEKTVDLKEKVVRLKDEVSDRDRVIEELRNNSAESVYRQLRELFGMEAPVNNMADVYAIIQRKDNNERAHQLLNDLGVKQGLLYHRVKLLADALAGVKGAFESGEES
jgi:hypothetical protein